MQAVATAAARQPAQKRGGLGSAAAAVFSALGTTFGNIFFIPEPWIGLVLALALVPQPAYVALALEGLVIGALVNRMLGFVDEPGSGGGVRTNAMLAAVVAGWATSASGLDWPMRIALAGAAAVPAAFLAAALSHFLSRTIMPAVLVAYCIAAAMVFAICPQCTVAASNAMSPWPKLVDATQWGEAFLRSLGAFMYGQDWAAGALVGLAVLAWSRAMFVCGLVGWIAGAAVAVGFEHMHLQFLWLPLSYNFFMAGSSLGAGVFVPGRASLPVATIAGALTSFFALAIQSALGQSSASFLPLSSALAIWVGIGALSKVRERMPVEGLAGGMNPEHQWWQLAYWRERFGEEVPLLAVPVPGEVEVTQGFNGSVSHRGDWRHALDFQRPRAAALPMSAVFGAEVRAPVCGIVERTCNDVADNAPGTCNYAQPYGNHVVIRMDHAESWVMLAHLQQGSVTVLPGMRVEVGSVVGRVGNSGRSAFAHLHMQVQSTPEPGAGTTAFRLANYLRIAPVRPNVRPWIASGVPAKGEVVCAAPVNAGVYHALSGISPGSGVWTVGTSGRIPWRFRPLHKGAAPQRIDISIDNLGRHVFTDTRGKKLVARLDPDAWRIVEIDPGCSSLLVLLAWSASTIPYAARAGMTWADHPPLAPWKRGLLLAPYARDPFVRVATICTAQPAAGTTAFETASRPDWHGLHLPVEVGCGFSALKGPVRLRAEFKGGSLEYSLLSFEPRSVS